MKDQPSPIVPRYIHTDVDRWDTTSQSELQYSETQDLYAFHPFQLHDTCPE